MHRIPLVTYILLYLDIFIKSISLLLQNSILKPLFTTTLSFFLGPKIPAVGFWLNFSTRHEFIPLEQTSDPIRDWLLIPRTAKSLLHPGCIMPGRAWIGLGLSLVNLGSILPWWTIGYWWVLEENQSLSAVWTTHECTQDCEGGLLKSSGHNTRHKDSTVRKGLAVREGAYRSGRRYQSCTCSSFCT